MFFFFLGSIWTPFSYVLIIILLLMGNVIDLKQKKRLWISMDSRIFVCKLVNNLLSFTITTRCFMEIRMWKCNWFGEFI